MILLQAYAYETRPNSLSFVQRHNGHLGSPQSRATSLSSLSNRGLT